MVAMHDNEIGIGAHHRERARQRPPQQRRIILDTVLPACRSGVEDELRLLGGVDEIELQAFADPDIALGSDMQAPPAECRVKRIIAPMEALPGLFSRGHYVVVEPGGYADAGDPLDDVIGSPRRIRQQYDALARCPQ